VPQFSSKYGKTRESLMNAWLKADQPSAHRWAYFAAGSLGGMRCATEIGRRLPDWSHQRAEQGVSLLLQIDNDLAVR
jgi:hypothetical protein